MKPTKNQIQSLVEWTLEPEVDFWSLGKAGRVSKVMISSRIKNEFILFLTENNIDFKLVVEDVAEKLKDEKEAREKFLAKRSKLMEGNAPDFELYWTNEQMETYTIQLAQKYPNLVNRDVIGKSIENRDISALRISSGSEFGKKPIIFVDTGTHAREWVGPHTVLYFIDQLVTNSSVAHELLEDVDWVFVPNVNPDGEFP